MIHRQDFARRILANNEREVVSDHSKMLAFASPAGIGKTLGTFLVCIWDFGRRAEETECAQFGFRASWSSSISCSEAFRS